MTTSTKSSTQLAATADSGYTQVTLNVSGELMQNNAASRAVDATHPIRVAQNLNGEPIIFSVGTADADTGTDTFYAIMRQPDSDTGWQQIDLSSGLGADLTVNAFAVSQSNAGAITLALAVESAAQPGVSQLYITAALPDDPQQVDWSNFTSQWVARPSAQGSFTIKEILLGTSDDQNGPPTIVVSTAQTGQDDSYWLVDADTTHTDAAKLWKQYHLPENTKDLIDIAVGSLPFPYGRGIYTLYGIGSDLTLAFNTLTSNPFGKTYAIDLNAPPDALALCAVANSNGYSDLYVSGDGLYVFPAGKQTSGATAATIADAQISTGLLRLDELLVATDAQNVSIWAKGNQEVLMYVTGVKGNDPQWSYPVSLRQNVAQIAALRNRVKQANEIFIVDGNNTLAYLWQDPQTTLWQETDIPLPDIGKVQTFNCYTTFINFSDQDGNPIASKAVSLTASSWTYATVNGAFYELGPDPVTVATDVQGNLTIINKVASVSTPFFHLQADFFDHVVDINPAAKIQDGLQKIESGDDLKKAQTQDGKPLISQDCDDDTVDNVAQGVQQLAALTATLPADGTTTGNSTANTLMAASAGAVSSGSHVSVRAAGSTPSNRIRTAGLPADYCWGMTFENGRAQYHEGAMARGQFLSRLPGVKPTALGFQGTPDTLSHNVAGTTTLGMFDPLDAVPAIAGDVFEALKNGLEEAGSFLIQAAGDAIEFIINLGDRIVKLTLDTVQHVLQAIDWLFQTIYVLLKDFLRWLGLLFNWDDILTTQQVFANVTTQTIKMFESKLASAESAVDDLFAQLKQQAQQNLTPLSDDTGSLNLKEVSISVPASVSDTAKIALDFLSGSPGGSFGSFQLLYSGMLNTNTKGEAASDELTNFMDNVLAPAVESIPQAVFDIITGLQRDFKAGTLTVNDVIKTVSTDAAIAMIDTLRDIAIGLLKLLADLLKDFRHMLNDEISVPFLTAFYEWATGDKFTLLNGITLLFSIPATTFYKLTANKAPFADGTYGLDTDEYQQLFRTLTGGTSAPASAAPEATNRMAAVDSTASALESDSSSEANAFGEAGMIYSQVGGGLYIGTQMANGALNAIAALSDDMESKLRSLMKYHLVLNGVYVASSFPVEVGKRTADNLEAGAWALDALSLAFDLTCYKASQSYQDQMQKFIGGYEVAKGVVDLILYSIILGFEVNEENNDHKGWDGVKYVQNVLSSVATGLYGVAILDKDEETKALELGVASGLDVIASIVNITRLVNDIQTDHPHNNF